MMLGFVFFQCSWAATIETSGLVEVEYNSAKDFEGAKTSRFALATVELGVDAELDKNISSHVLFLYEQGNTEFDADEGTITYKIGASPVAVTAGKMYVPFGRFETMMISDPLTLEIGETNETALHLTFKNDLVTAGVYAFNGDTIKADMAADGDDTMDHFGAHLGLQFKPGPLDISVGASYINSLADSDGISGVLSEITDGTTLADYSAGVSAYLDVGFKGFWLLGETVTTQDAFAVDRLPFDGKESKPSATNIELSYTLDSGGHNLTLGFALQSTEQAMALRLPETRTLFALSYGSAEGAAIGLEVGSDKDYEVGGEQKDGSLVNIQLAVEF